MLQDVVDIGPDGRQHIDAMNITAGAQEARVHHIVHDQGGRPAQCLEFAGEFAGLLRARGQVENDQLSFGRLLRQRRDQPEAAHLLVQAVFMRPNHGTVHRTTTAKLRRAQTSLACVASALLPIRLLGRARHLGQTLNLVVTGAALRELPVHNPRHDIGSRLGGENVVRQFRAAGGSLIQGGDFDLHRLYPQPSAGAGVSGVAGIAASINAAG